MVFSPDLFRRPRCAVRKAVEWLGQAHEDEDQSEGQGMVEYALILMLIAIVVIVVVGSLGHRVSNIFSNVNNGFSQ